MISSRGHQMLTLHEPTSSDSSQIDSDPDLKDITHDLPDLSSLWQNNSTAWSDDYRPDLNPLIRGRSSLLDEVFTRGFADNQDIVDVSTLDVPDSSNSHLQIAAMRDTVDWQFDPDLLQSYHPHYGPFPTDACADNAGHNAQCNQYWSPDNSCTCHLWAGLTVWCNPPSDKTKEILDHAAASYYDNPEKTRSLFVFQTGLMPSGGLL